MPFILLLSSIEIAFIHIRLTQLTRKHTPQFCLRILTRLKVLLTQPFDMSNPFCKQSTGVLNAAHMYIPCNITPPNINLLFWHVHAIFNFPSVKCIFHLCGSENESTNKMPFGRFWMFLFHGFELFRTVLSVKRLWCHVKGFPPSPATEDGWERSRLTAERKRHWWSQIFICEPSTAGLISQKEVSVNHLKHKKKACSNADHVVYACLCWIIFVRFFSLHVYSSVLFDEEMNDPNCQQNVTCIYLYIQRKKHVLYTD